MEDGIAEKRLHQRIDKSFTARFKEEGSPHWDIVILQSLSAGGALFKFNRKLPIGSRVDLRINFPFYDVSAISVPVRSFVLKSR